MNIGGSGEIAGPLFRPFPYASETAESRMTYY